MHARGGGKRPRTAQLRSSGRGVPPPNGGSSALLVGGSSGGVAPGVAPGVPPPNGGELRSSDRGGAPPNGASSALSLLIIINLVFFAMGGGADIIVVIGFTRSYDSGLCCFIGSIIPRGVRPRTTPYCSAKAERCDTVRLSPNDASRASQQSVAALLNAPRMRDTGSSPLELTVGKN